MSTVDLRLLKQYTLSGFSLLQRRANMNVITLQTVG
jgi:hypothetical protein